MRVKSAPRKTNERPAIARGDVILEVKDLNVDFFVEDTWYPAAIDVNFDVRAGEVLAIVGESGSGKTQSSMALLGLLPPNGRSSGSAKLMGQELVGLTGAPMRRVRGKEIAVIFQEPMTALNPVYTIGFQIVEQLRSHFDMDPVTAKARAIELLTLVEIPEPERRFDSYPHQLSGGQRQRAMIAQALSCDPRLLVADEPTTALDVTVQAEILKLLRDLRDKIDSGIILITHDMGIVADISDKMVVMRNGKIVERGTADEIFNRPQHPYTQELLAAVPHLGTHSEILEGADTVVKQPADTGAAAIGKAEVRSRRQLREAAEASDFEFDEANILQAENLVLEYPKRGRHPAFRAVDGVTFSVKRGEVVGLVGESGSGKTTIGRSVVGLLPVHSGHLTIDGISLVGATHKDLKPLRSKVGIVFQDPGSSLNPRLPIGESIGEPLMLHTGAKGEVLSKKVEEMLDQVELPRSFRNRYPHELSGGQRQRVGIARSLILEPALLVADEPTSALDVSVQARVLELFQELQREHGFACLFISHDLAVVEMLSARIAVMHDGKLVEYGETGAIVNRPQHPYTQRLIAAVPVPDPEAQKARREARDRLLAAEGAGIDADELARALRGEHTDK